MNTSSTIQRLEQTLSRFRQSSSHFLSERDFAEFEDLIQQLPDTAPEKVAYFQQAGEALFARMVYDRAEYYLEQALSLAKKQKRYTEQALALGSLAELKRVQGAYRQAFSFLNEALDILAQHENDLVAARLSILAGLNDIALGMYESAAQRFYKAYIAYTKLNDTTGVALALIRMGTAEMMQEKYQDAQKHLTESLALSNTIGDKHLMAGALTNLGEVYRLLKDYEQAQDAYAQANQLFEEMGLERGVAITMNNMGHLYGQTGDYEQARECYRKAQQITANRGLFPEMMDSLAGMAILLHEQGRTTLARKIVQRLINVPTLLDESKGLLQPLVREFHLEMNGAMPISSEELQTLFAEALTP